VGDGTTSAVVLAGEFLKQAESLLDQGVHSTVITNGYRLAMNEVKKYLEQLAISAKDDKSLMKVAETALSGKNADFSNEMLAELVVKAVDLVAEEKIYEMTFQNPIITYVFGETTKKMISILGMQQRMVGKNFLIGMIVPEAVESEFQEILGDLAVKFKDWKPIVSSVSRLEEAISG
jgi:thermosome subunit